MKCSSRGGFQSRPERCSFHVDSQRPGAWGCHEDGKERVATAQAKELTARFPISLGTTKHTHPGSRRKALSCNDAPAHKNSSGIHPLCPSTTPPATLEAAKILDGRPTSLADSSNQICLLKQSVRALKSSFGSSLDSPPFPRTTNQAHQRTPLHWCVSNEGEVVPSTPKIFIKSTAAPSRNNASFAVQLGPPKTPKKSLASRHSNVACASRRAFP
ncbi:hypothetical protein B0J18DRAFT_109734 [Chaetomium sp. MPI-SDFR-AT-0129]|nr:hypothetical protein B0J18DRAFT_109734 [Chaetomium sp. MPI-SDFR-AT-0129]